MDVKLESLLNNMFIKCISDGQSRHAIGIAIETQRMDWFREAIMKSVSFYMIYISKKISNRVLVDTE